jgi:hypothetical protein
MSSVLTDQVKRLHDYFDGPNGRQHYEYLAFFADQIIRSSGGIWGKGNLLPSSKDARDVVQDVFIALTTPKKDGSFKRNIPPDRDLRLVFCNIIKSYVSHAFAKKTFWIHAAEPAQSDDEGEGWFRRAIEDPATAYWEPDGDRLTAEERVKASKRCREIIEFARSDTRAHAIMTLIWEEGISKPAELAERLNLPVQEIYRCQKRMATLGRQFRIKEASRL